MGLRVRLKASFDVSQLAPQARPIAIALKRYGMILADNGSPWYITGVSSHSFSDDGLHTLGLDPRQRPRGGRHQLAAKRLSPRLHQPAAGEQLPRQ